MKPRLRFLYSVQWVEGRTGHDHPERLTRPYAVRSSSALSLADRSCPLLELILRTTPVLVLPGSLYPSLDETARPVKNPAVQRQ